MTAYQRWTLFVLVVALPWVLRGVLSLFARRRGASSLRPIIPAFGILMWGLWILCGVFLVLDRVQGFLLAAYGGTVLVFHWLKREAAFEDGSVDSPVSLVLRIPAGTWVGVRSPETVSEWYVQKLGMRRLAERVGGTVVLKFDGYGQSLTLEPCDQFYPRGTPILYTSSIEKAQSVLESRGISVGRAEKDRQGTRQFEIRDSEGNMIEVSEEPAGGLGGEIF